MAEVIDLRDKTPDETTLLSALVESGDVDITECNTQVSLDDNTRYKKLSLAPGERVQICALLQHIPAAVATAKMATTYVLTVPNGLPYTLMKTKAGEYLGVLVGPNGRIVHLPRLTPVAPMATQAAMLGAFTAMSIASGQYFLAQVNSEMKLMRQGLDKILEFLYGDKKAELMSEISFAKYAFENFESLMSHEAQRIATITGLQQSKKVAMKDIEFYLEDLDSIVASKETDILATVDKAFQVKESLELSMQLCIMSTLLEVYYSENFEPDYLQYVEETAVRYIGKCDKKILNGFSVLGQQVSAMKSNVLKKVNKEPYEERIAEMTNTLVNQEESELCQMFRSVLHAATEKSEYYITNEGDVYIKAC